MFANLGNALCDAFDSLLWAIPTSTTRGKSKHGICHCVDNYICIGVCAAQVHKGVNCVQSGLQKVPIVFQKVIKTFVSESEHLFCMWSSSMNIVQTKEGMTTKQIEECASSAGLPAGAVLASAFESIIGNVAQMKAHVTVINKTHMHPFTTGINQGFANSFPHAGR